MLERVKKYNVLVDGANAHHDMVGADDAEYKVLLEHPGFYITHKLHAYRLQVDAAGTESQLYCGGGGRTDITCHE